ncbi:MAG: DMT family transporter [Acidiferrobacterales bacterium]|nr:DMT family transporter [Acidiferrobacterales bacterium]
MHYAILWMFGTVVSYSAVAIATREASYVVDTPTILFIRSLVAIVLVTLLLGFSRQGFTQVRTDRVYMHVARNCVHFVGQFGWFFSIALIPLAHVFALEFTTPIWIALLAPVFLNEKLTMSRVLCILVGFVGVMIIVRPFGMGVEVGSVAMLIGAAGFAGAMLFTRKLLSTESPLCILFYMAIMQLPMSTGLLVLFGDFQFPDLSTLFLIVFITAGVMFSHYCMARAFQLAEVSAVVPVEYLRLPLIAIAGALLYAEPIDLATIVGGAAIIAANYMNLRSSAR